MNALSATLMIKALDGLTARSDMTAENIANAQTPGYRPGRVRFEDALASAARSGVDAVRSVQPTIERAGDAEAASGVRLDLELATASTTALRYSALVELLSREAQLDNLAITGNP